MKKTTAIITAINYSNTFPNRSLLLFEKKTVLEIICQRLLKSKYINKIVLCTTENTNNNSLVECSKNIGIECIRANTSNNILPRMLAAYKKLKIDNAVIVRGDTPLIDPFYCDKLLEKHYETNAEFSYNNHMFGLPYGLGCEIINIDVLEKMCQFECNSIDTANPALYLKFHESIFKVYKYTYKSSKPDYRLILENKKDYVFLKEIISFVGINCNMNDLLNLLDKHPYLTELNKPYADINEIGLEKLMLFPSKIDKLINNYSDFSYPISVELSLTNYCNLNCIWCSDKKLRNKRPAKLSFQTYKKLILDLVRNGTKGIVIEGGGEPTIYPEFKDSIQFALDNKLAVGLITNGVKFDYEKLIPKMEWVRISLDADTRDIYKKWKGKDSFYEVLNNIRDMCRIENRCTIGIGYVVTNANVEHIEEITLLLSEIGVDYIYFRPVIDNPELIFEDKLLNLKKFETDTFKVMIHAMEENTVSGNSDLPCTGHSLSSVIAADGSVFLCGRLNIYDWFEPIGNINTSTFKEIWTGEKRLSQMKQVLSEQFCKKWCPECRITKYNKLLSNVKQIKTRNFI